MSLHLLPGYSRIWIFTFDFPISDATKSLLQTELQQFVNAWTAHGKLLSAGFELFGDAMLAVAIDEQAETPSGCSIDKVFRLLQDFGKVHGVDFFKRTQILVPSFDSFEVFSAESAVKLFETGVFDEHTMIANTLAPDLKTYRQNPLIPLGESWLSKKLVSKMQD